MALTGDPATQLVLRWGDGRQDIYTPNGDGTFTGPPDTRESLTATAGGYELVARDHSTFRFDTAGKLVSISDSSSNTTNLGYDAGGRLTTITDPSNRTVTLSYGADGRISSVRDALSREWAYTYVAGNLATATDPAGGVWRYEYNAEHRLTKLTNPAGDEVVTNAYGPDGKVSEQTDAAGGRWAYAYGASTTTVTDPLGNPTVYEFDADFRTRRVTDALGGTTEFIWDARSNLVAVVDATGAATRYAFDERDNVTAILDSAGHKLGLAYDASDNLVSIVDGKGAQHAFSYDSASRLTSVATPAGRQIDIAYRSDGLPDRVTAGDGGVRSYQYDVDGLLEAVTDALGRTTSLDLDAAGQLLSVTDPAGSTSSYGYDPTGRIVATTDAEGHITSYTYDAAGRLTAETDPNGHTTSYEYNPQGRPTAVQDALGRRTTLAYDSAGRLASRTDPRALTVAYTYDAAGRLTRIDLPDLADTTFSYDAAGRVTAMNDAAGTHSYDYDPAGRLIAEHQHLVRHNLPGGYDSDLAYTYDALGRRKTLELTHFGSTSLHNLYHYDPDGRIQSLTDTVSGVTLFGYDPAGRLETITNPEFNGVVSTYDYDLAGQLLELSHRHAGVFVGDFDDALSTWQYAYDAAGRRSTVTRRLDVAGTEIARHTAAYGYDRVGQLVSATGDDPQAPPEANATYTYDPAGNRTSRTVAGAVTTSYTYDAADQLLSDGANTYDHDGAGNLVAVRPFGLDAARTYGYDSLGRLTSISDPAGTTSYGYDGLDRRVTKVDASSVGGFVFDGLDMIEEFGGLTTAVNTTVDGFFLNRISADPVYFHPDGSGNVGETTDIDGFVLSRHAYEPFGGHTTTAVGAAVDNLNNRNTFSGAWGVRDEAGGLLDMRARMYDPSLGQFLTRDPLEALTGEAYSYAGNDPVNYADPYGLNKCEVGLNPLRWLGNAVDCASKADPTEVVQAVNTASSYVAGGAGLCAAAGAASIIGAPLAAGCGTVAAYATTVNLGTGAALMLTGNKSPTSYAVDAALASTAYGAQRAATAAGRFAVNNARTGGVPGFLGVPTAREFLGEVAWAFGWTVSSAANTAGIFRTAFAK